MTIALPSWRRTLVLVAAVVGTLIVANPAQAQQVTGARANKDCPGTTATPGQTIICNFDVENTGALPATVTTLREISPFPGGTPVNITCTTAGGVVITVGSTLFPATPCAGTFQVMIPNDPTLCGTAVADRVEIALRYTDVLVADAGATGITFIVCPANITITKTADALSKVGDSVTYTFRICNVGAGIANRGSVTDTLLGDLTTFFPATLAPGQCVDVVRMRTVQAGDPDPLPNTVTATYSSGASSDTETASASTNLFQPSITIVKTGDTLSKAGDEVNYTITVCNTSSTDTPALQKDSVTDTLIGGVNAAFGASLTPGQCESHNFTRTVLAGDPDPLVNTATAHYHPAGFPNDINASDSHSVNLFQPSITIVKTGDTLSKAGDEVNYTITVCNTSSTDTPALQKDSVTDTLIGGVNAAFGASLTPGQCESHNFTRTVLAGDPDPLVNTATAHYHPAGFPNDINASDSHSVNLFQPSVSVTKNCTPDPVEVGGVLICTIVVTNTSSNDTPTLINGTIVDTLTGNLLDPANTAVISSNCTPSLPSGGTCTIVTRRTVLATDPNPLVNTVTVNYNPTGFPNNITATATRRVEVKPPKGGEGCTPGFWKQEHHFDSWVGFSPNQTLESVFNVPDSLGLDDVTLAEALALNGGGVNALLRHAVAALLNASNPDVDFDLTAAQVISATNAALASGNYEAQKNIFAALNEQGCPLS